jgi:lysophospholipase L1-like esterase
MKAKKVIILMSVVFIISYYGEKIHDFYSPAKERQIYRTHEHHDDTLRIAYIGDSWALGHSESWTFGNKPHFCQLSNIIKDSLNRPVTVESYGISGLTSKKIYYALFESNSFKSFIQKGYDYCYVSAGINDTYGKMSTSYYTHSMDCIIRFLITNHIHPIIQEIPDYNIVEAYKSQNTYKKFLRHISMFINATQMDCKQQFREALNKLIIEKDYQNKVSIVRYKSWNNNYENDLKELYISDQIHLNDKGYAVLDHAISKVVLDIEH